MITFGILNLPLPEIFFILIIIFFVFLVMIIIQLQKLKQMTADEQKELIELSRLAQEEKKDLEQIKAYEQMESKDLTIFEKGIHDLEEDTDTLYLKKLAPDLYKLQNYTLWAIKKGLDPKQIKENLINKGWKDENLIEMVINDTLKYTGYYNDKKGDVSVPNIKIEETTKIIRPVKVVKVGSKKKVSNKKTVSRKKPKPKVKKTTAKKIAKKKPVVKKKPKLEKTDSFDDIEKELQKLETDLKKETKTEKKTVKKPKSAVKKGTGKKATKKQSSTKKATVVKTKKATVKKTARRAASPKKSGSSMVIGTKGGNSYHKPTCIVMKKVTKEKVVTFKNNEEALKKGYKPCTVCAVESRQ